MNKKMILNDGNIVILDKQKGYCTSEVSIMKYYLENDNLLKKITLSIWDDMFFSGYSNNTNMDTLEFEFDISDPLYFCLNRLLNNDKTLIIDDDNTCELMTKYMIIKKENELIKIIFRSAKKSDKNCEKFRVFIKNIGPDPRSKITDCNMKFRLVDFFRDCEHRLLEEYHQVTIDEYCEELRQKKFKNYSKVLKINKKLER